MMKKHVLALAISAVLLAACGKKEEPAPAPAPVETTAAAPAAPAGPVLDDEKVLNIYNWPDYITETMIADFEKETGVKVNYDTFENNEALHAKLVAGNSGYDIVIPTAGFGKKQIDGGLYQEIDKTKIPNYANLDPEFMAKIAGVDPGNKHFVPWAWGFTTVGINKQKVEKALGGMPMPENAWDLVFKPEYANKLKGCGIIYLYFTEESFQYACKPVFCAVDLERKYLQKAGTSNGKQPISPLESEEIECLTAFQKLNTEEQRLLSGYSQKMCSRSVPAWKEWLRTPVGEQVRAAKAGLGGEK